MLNQEKQIETFQRGFHIITSAVKTSESETYRRATICSDRRATSDLHGLCQMRLRAEMFDFQINTFPPFIVQRKLTTSNPYGIMNDESSYDR